MTPRTGRDALKLEIPLKAGPWHHHFSCNRVAARTPQCERFERCELAIWSHDIVVDDLHGGRAAALRSRINREGREAVGMRCVPDRRPGCIFPDIDRRA